MRILRELRKAKGLSIKELSERTGFGLCTLYSWERDASAKISLTAAGALAEALGISVDEILKHADEGHIHHRWKGDIKGEPLEDCFAYGGRMCMILTGDLCCINPKTGKRCGFYKTREAYKRDAARAKAIYEKRSNA